MNIQNMQFNAGSILPLWEKAAESAPATETESGGAMFADIFKSLVNNVRETEDVVAKNEYLLATGQLDNPSELGLAQLKADAATSLLIQIRDKVLNAYSELSRMSV